MAVSNTQLRQLAIGAGALLVGLLIGAIWRSTRTPPSPAPPTAGSASPSAGPASPSSAGSASSAPSLSVTPPGPDGGGARQAYSLAPNPHFPLPPLRQLDRDIFAQVAAAKYDRESMLDVFPGTPNHVRFIGDAHNHWVNVVIIDLGRDGTWDEKWTLTVNDVERVTFDKPKAENWNPSPRDARYALRYGAWQPY